MSLPWHPLEASRIERFLNQLDRVGVDVGHLHTLLQNESTPLMTDVILQTFEGKPEAYLREVRVGDVWQNFVTRKFEDERNRREAAGSPLPYPPAFTVKWLNWIARQLGAHTRDTNRFFVEELQPDWLSRGQLFLANALAFLVLLAIAYLLTQVALRAGVPILYGQEGVRNYLGDYLWFAAPLLALWMVLLVWTFARRPRSPWAAIVLGMVSGAVFGTTIWIPYRGMPALALIGGAITAFLAVVLVTILTKILGQSDRQITCVKRRKWDWSKAGSGLVIGIAFVLVIGLISDVARAIFLEGAPFWPALQKALSFDTVIWWNWGLPGMLSMSLFFLLVLGLGRARWTCAMRSIGPTRVSSTPDETASPSPPAASLRA